MVTLLIGSMLFSTNIFFVKAQTDIHDLEAGLSSFSPSIISGMYNHMLNGTSTVLNATVTNTGNVNESNVSLELLINGSESLNATTATLDVNSTFWAAYYWSPANGDYNLTVYAPPVAGETDIANNNFTAWVRVCPPQAPTANFTFNTTPLSPAPGPVSSYSTVYFNASSSFDSDWSNITNYAWNFGDNNNGSGSSTSHMYTAWGNMTVTLTVWAENLSGSTSQNITVYALPVANFSLSPSPYYVNTTTVIFNASASYDPDNLTAPNSGIASYTWDFNDSTPITTVTNATITHIFNNAGNYNVTLTVTDYVDLTGQFGTSVSVVSGNPIASFTAPPQPCYVGYSLTFNASASYDPKNSTGPNNGIASYTWDFDDGNITTVTNATITHTYQNPGNYNVNLTITDYEGLTGSMNETVNVSFQVFVSVVDASTGNTTINTYNPGQTFNVAITITNVVALDYFQFNLTYTPSILKVISVSDANFTLGPYTVDQLKGQIAVVSSASIGGQTGNFTLATITFSVENPGDCTLPIVYSLLRNSVNGTIDCTTVPGYFYTTTPVALFTYSPSNPAVNSNVTFDASKSYCPDNGTIVSYDWNFGDNTTTGTGIFTSHIYLSQGRFYVNLTVEDGKSGNFWSFGLYVNVTAGGDIGVIDVAPNMRQFNATLGLYETAGTLPINVTVTNDGGVPENFTVTMYFNDTFIENETVTSLELGVGGNYTFTFDNYTVKNVPPGVYNINVNATPVPGQTDLSEINRAGGTIKVYLQGDFLGDGTVDIYDAIALADAYGSTPGSPNWNPNADILFDSIVDIYDAIALASNFGA